MMTEGAITSVPGQRQGESPPRAIDAPIVSVAMVTYNHERFVVEAIESVLMQQTNFPVELVIGEDCSKDRTLQIVLGYQERYPDRIRVIVREKNIGSLANFVQTLQACRGKYVAILEGDDYWTNPHKLQKQVDFLDANPDYIAAAHNAMRYDHATQRDLAPCCIDTPARLRLADFLPMNQVPTCTVMYRNGLITAFPKWFVTLPAGDWALHVLHTRIGDMHYDSEIMARYRVHSDGMWSGLARAGQLAGDLVIYQHFLEELGNQWAKPIRKQMRKRFLNLMYQQEKDTNLADARQTLVRFVRFNGVSTHSIRPAVWVAAGRLFTPRSYNLLLRTKNAVVNMARRATGHPAISPSSSGDQAQ